MNKTVLIVSVLLCLLAQGVCAGERILFSEDFTTPDCLSNHWRLDERDRNGRIVVRDGRLRMPQNSRNLRWIGSVPFDFSVEADVALRPAWGKNNPDPGKGWAGLAIKDVAQFAFRGVGKTFLLGKGYNRYCPIEDYEDGKPVRLKVTRRRCGGSAVYAFVVNGKFCGSWRLPIPEKTSFDGREEWPQPELHVNGNDIEVTRYVLAEITDGEVSPNLIANSGFEREQEGLPIFYAFHGMFDWNGRPADDYEKVYLRRYSIDRREFHSGRQSLRIEVGGTSKATGFRSTCDNVAVEGKTGVFSLWMKTSRPGLKARLEYGKAKKIVEVSSDWARYEVVADEPFGKQNWFTKQVRVSVEKPAEHEATLWVDDLQAEVRTGANPHPDRPWASPYRPAEDDEIRLATCLAPQTGVPRGSTPVRSADENMLHGYVLKAGEPLVLADRDYYMKETVARFRIWDERGRLAETSLDVARLPFGTNDVTVCAHGRFWAARVVRRPWREGATQIDNFSRTLRHDGHAIALSTPCILCSATDPDAKGRFRDLDYLKTCGFSAVHVNCWNRPDYLKKIRAYVSQAKELGLDLLVWIDALGKTEPNSDVLMDELDDTNVFSFQVLDETDLSVPSEIAEAALARAKMRHPYAGVQMNTTGAGAFFRRYGGLRTDILMIDTYLTNAEGRRVRSVVSHVDDMLRADPGKGCWYFGVATNDLHYRQPTYEEMLAQGWGWICSGGTGISWFVNMPKSLAVWRGMVDFNRELQSVREPLLSDEICGGAGANAGSDRLRFVTRLHCGDWYVFACNIGDEPLEHVSFTLPPDAPKACEVKVLFEDRSLKLANGVFTDDFRPLARHVYRLAN